MRNWCKIVEKNNRQYLLTHEFDHDTEEDKVKISVDLSDESENIGIIAISMISNDIEGFSQEFVDSTFENADKFIESFEEQIASSLIQFGG